MARTAYLIGLLLFAVATGSFAQQASQEDFNAYRNALEGRWVGQITWIADWPGFGKKGDKVTGYSHIRAVADGRILVGEFYGGNGTGRWITVYDAGARQILEVGSDSGGSTSTCVIFREAGQWRSRCTGSLADGTKTDGTWTLEISDDGNTHRWGGTGTVGGAPMDPLQDVWTRVGR